MSRHYCGEFFILDSKALDVRVGKAELFILELSMQTVMRRLFLFGICIIAFHILALNTRIAKLMVLSSAVLTAFLVLVFIVLVEILATRHYNRKRLRAMHNQIKVVASILEKYEPKRMPPGSMHEMAPGGEDGLELEKIRKSVVALEARVADLNEAMRLHDEIAALDAELMRLLVRAFQRMPFPKLK